MSTLEINRRKAALRKQNKAQDNWGKFAALTLDKPCMDVDESKSLLTQACAPMNMVPRITNIVVTVDVECHLDLKLIAQQMRNINYNPKRFAGAVCQIRDPKVTALLFSSGKLVCLGAKTIDDARLGCRKFIRKLNCIGFRAKWPSSTDVGAFKVQNMVAALNTHSVIRLDGLQGNTLHHLYISYEPEIFPALVYTFSQYRIKMLIFHTGKIVITGARYEQHIYEALASFWPVLNDYRILDKPETI